MAYKDVKEAKRTLIVLESQLDEINSENFLLSDYLTIGAKNSSQKIHFDPASKEGKYLLEAVEFGLKRLIGEAKSFIHMSENRKDL